METRAYFKRFVLLRLMSMAFMMLQSCSQSYDVKKDPPKSTNVIVENNDPDVICNPFGEESEPVTLRAGLVGNIYHSPPEDKRKFVDEVIQYGTKASAELYLPNLNVPARSWSSGFPSSSGSLLLDNFGEELVEWFALSLNSNLVPSNNFPAGQYQIGVLSDDGVIISERKSEGTFVEIFNHDGHHAPTFKCATVPIQISDTIPLPLQIKYFQGPRYQIALQVSWRPWSASNESCSQNHSSWTTIPSENYELDSEILNRCMLQ